jgi:hypothetical protein
MGNLCLQWLQIDVLPGLMLQAPWQLCHAVISSSSTTILDAAVEDEDIIVKSAFLGDG